MIGTRAFSLSGFFFLFFKFWLCWVFVTMYRLSLIVVSRGLLCSVLASRRGGSSCCGAWPPGARTQQFWRMGSVAPCHVGSAWTRDRTCVRECLSGFLLSFLSLISDSLSVMPSFFQTDVFHMAVDKLLLGTRVTSLVFLSEHPFFLP